jgi:hypothetical protein
LKWKVNHSYPPGGGASSYHWCSEAQSIPKREEAHGVRGQSSTLLAHFSSVLTLQHLAKWMFCLS